MGLRRAPAAFGGSENDLCARHRIGTCFVMRKRDVQMTAHVGKPRRTDIPDGTSHSDGADERVLGWPQAVAFAAGFEDATVKRCMMSRQKIQTGQRGFERPPYFGERGRVLHVFPRQTMNARKPEFLRGRTNQIPLQVHDAAVPHKRHPKRTRTIKTVMSRLKVDGREIVHLDSFSPWYQPNSANFRRHVRRTIQAEWYAASDVHISTSRRRRRAGFSTVTPSSHVTRCQHISSMPPALKRTVTEPSLFPVTVCSG